jgi:hypothetical protein
VTSLHSACDCERYGKYCSLPEDQPEFLIRTKDKEATRRGV